MNERKQKRYIYLNSPVSELQKKTDNLLVEILNFIETTTPTAADWFVLNNMIKKLEQGADNSSNKVLRGMRHRFYTIKQSYTRG